MYGWIATTKPNTVLLVDLSDPDSVSLKKLSHMACLGHDSQTGWNKQIPKHHGLKKLIEY